MPVSIINTLPSFISPEQHQQRTAETPTSFSDIPPVLRHKQENVRAVFQPPVQDLSEDELKNGTIYVLESVLAFISTSSGRGFQIDYPSIILHAVSRSDPPSIYCQLGEPASEEQDGAEDEEETTDLRELSIYPENASSLTELFEAMSHCASLHPDLTSASDDGLDDDDDDAFVDADVEAVQAMAGEGVDGEPDLSEAGRGTLEHLERLIQDHYYPNPITVNGHHEPSTIGSDTEEDRFADAEMPTS